MNGAAVELGVIFASVAFLLNVITILVGIYKLGRSVEKFENIGEQQAREINELKTAVKAIAELMTSSSLQEHRVQTLEGRMILQDKLIDDLRRGEAWILPLAMSPHEVPKRRDP